VHRNQLDYPVLRNKTAEISYSHVITSPPPRRPWGTDVPCNLISFLHPVQFPSNDATEEPIGPQQG